MIEVVYTLLHQSSNQGNPKNPKITVQTISDINAKLEQRYIIK